MAAEEPLVEIRDLTQRHVRHSGPRAARAVAALSGASLTIRRGATVALVGPSGSGKSTLARCLARLEEPVSGEIRFEGTDVRALRGAALREFRQSVQLVLQEAAAALDPRFTVLECVAEPLEILGRGSRDERAARARELMDKVGLGGELAPRRPLDLSGGQRQRVAIARALAVEPRLLILDEAFSGLDAPIQAQIATLLQDLQRERGLTYLVISHDLALMSVLADEVAILSDGRVVEQAAARDLFLAPQHPATRSLVAAVAPVPDLDDPRRAADG
jgi:peptide/nickel transport system ATP-binding protein